MRIFLREVSSLQELFPVAAIEVKRDRASVANCLPKDIAFVERSSSSKSRGRLSRKEILLPEYSVMKSCGEKSFII